MKRNIKIIVLSGMISLVSGTFSCKKYLDKSPESIVSEKTAFKDFTNFQGYTEELYNCIPDFTNRYWTNSWNWGDDEIQSSALNFHFVNKIDNGDFWGWQREFDGWGAGWMDVNNANTNDDRFTKGLWPLAWYGIRKANLGLENMNLLTNATDEERNLIKGQLLFFRGWFHFQLMQYFGGLPYIDKVLPADQDLRSPRLKYQECAEKAAADFREAADLLPLNWDNTGPGGRTPGKNQLRIDKTMALGYLGKNYLWAGSPLMNYESTGSRTYNVELCKKAAAAFAELLKLSESGQTPYKLLPFDRYYTNFYTFGQNWQMPGGGGSDGLEAIFRGPYWDAHGSTYGTAKQYTPGPTIEEGNVVFAPTANYINNYGMKNGLPITNSAQADAESGYDPQYPWRNRDPRFYNDIVFDGIKLVKGSLPSTVPEFNRYANLFTGGSSRDERVGSRTGYLLYKFTPITSNKFDQGYAYGQNLNIKVPYMRLADIYLMYAEAVTAGYSSPSAKDPSYAKSAVDAINVIRDRAGVGHVAARFLGSADEFMKEVRRERAVELSFEGHRFTDLRRWLQLIELPYTLKTAIEFDRAAPLDPSKDPKDSRVVNFRERTILQRPFSEKHYWLPLKRADVSMYAEFKQNPGW
ncbi:RagB/SusD family nutrient uptake outer membrane protein [Mucilaginibacter defluvii]|uniref:RagB/SusD family nutrient uptake outer membrane protein n=1 Tax=Mucilaginibacter defluvii TaxID=1196019 RepID=A0ABP9G185_9SPHI